MAYVNGVESTDLKNLVDRIEGIEADAAAAAAEHREMKKDAFEHAKATGYDVKALRAVLAERKLRRKLKQDTADLVDIYNRALELTPIEEEIAKTGGGSAVVPTGNAGDDDVIDAEELPAPQKALPRPESGDTLH